MKLFRSRKIPASVEKKRSKELQKQRELNNEIIQKEKEQLSKLQPQMLAEKDDIADKKTINEENNVDEVEKPEKTIKKQNTKTSSKKENEETSVKTTTTELKTEDDKESKPKKYKQTTLFDF